MDFTISKYRELILALQKAGYSFLSLEEYLTMEQRPELFVILRHDIDLRAKQALQTAAVEKAAGAHASYYFRVVPASNQPEVIRQIAEMGFEIGYHYEDMSIADGDAEKAKKYFCEWLQYFRKYYPVRTICMHGAPSQRYDSRDLWKTADYKEFGIIGEPYFDVDFADIFYLTDTGRRWDGYKVSVRDKIPGHQDRWTASGWVYHTTDDIIRAAQAGTLPPHILMTTHPQRWTQDPLLWIYELLRQTVVNLIKLILISLSK